MVPDSDLLGPNGLSNVTSHGLHYDILNRTKEQRTYINLSAFVFCGIFSGGVSGGHLNPAVTLAMAAIKKLKPIQIPVKFNFLIHTGRFFYWSALKMSNRQTLRKF